MLRTPVLLARVHGAAGQACQHSTDESAFAAGYTLQPPLLVTSDAGDTGELLSWAREKKSPSEIKAEVDQLLRETKPAKTPRELLEREIAGRKKRSSIGRGTITEELARELPRFEFIAHWLAVVTRKKENRGPLGLYVRRHGKRWQIVSTVWGGTVTFETTDPALLFDYARRGQLGPHIRDAEEFRGLAYQRAEASHG